MVYNEKYSIEDMKNSPLCSKVSDIVKMNKIYMNEKENIEAKLLICKSGDLLLARP